MEEKIERMIKEFLSQFPHLLINFQIKGVSYEYLVDRY